MSRLALLFLVAGLACASCAAPERVPGTSDVTARLETRIPALLEEAGVPGFTIAVVEHGDLVWSRAYGMASDELDRPTTTETIFEAASLGKVVLALITLRLADRGTIDLDELLADSLEYPLLDHDERFAALTPRLILQHAAGLPNWGGWALDENRDPVQFVGVPGDGFRYSGEAYTSLQRFVEVRTGRSLEELFRELAAEAGMSSSSFISHAVGVDRYAQGRRIDGSERPIIVFDRPFAAFSLVSTAEDLARFTAFYFRRSGLSTDAYEESLRAVNPVPGDAWGFEIPAGAAISWSLAWAVQESEAGRVFLHAGNNGEFRSFIAYSRDRDVAVALMANGVDGLSFLSELLDSLVGDITPAAVWWGYEQASD